MASEYLHQKWKTVFIANDINKDGFITLEDANMFANRFTIHHKMGPEQAMQLKTAFRGFWQSLFLYDRETMSPETYVTLMAQEYKKNRSEFCERMYRILDNCTNLFDVDNDGYVSAEEYLVVMRCWGISSLDREFVSAFPQFKPGYIAKNVYRDAWLTFFTNDDKNDAEKESPILFGFGLIGK